MTLIGNFDMKLDHLVANTATVGLTPIIKQSNSNLTMHVVEFINGTVLNGQISSTGPVELNGTFHLIFDRLQPGTWGIKFASYDSYTGNPITSTAYNVTERTCRTFTDPLSEIFGPLEARYIFNVTSTNDKCGFNKGSRDWALYVYIAIGSFAGLLLFFSIVTLCVSPLRKAIWYPPM